MRIKKYVLVSSLAITLFNNAQQDSDPVVLGALNSVAFATNPLNAFTLADFREEPEIKLMVAYGLPATQSYRANKPYYYLGYAIGSTLLAGFGAYATKNLLQQANSVARGQGGTSTFHKMLLGLAIYLAFAEGNMLSSDGQMFSLNTHLSNGDYTLFIPYTKCGYYGCAHPFIFSPNFILPHASLGFLAGSALITRNLFLGQVTGGLVLIRCLLDAILAGTYNSNDLPATDQLITSVIMGFVVSLALGQTKYPQLTKALAMLIGTWTATGALVNMENLRFNVFVDRRN